MHRSSNESPAVVAESAAICVKESNYGRDRANSQLVVRSSVPRVPYYSRNERHIGTKFRVCGLMRPDATPGVPVRASSDGDTLDLGSLIALEHSRAAHVATRSRCDGETLLGCSAAWWHRASRVKGKVASVRVCVTGMGDGNAVAGVLTGRPTIGHRAGKGGDQCDWATFTRQHLVDSLRTATCSTPMKHGSYTATWASKHLYG